MSEKKSKRPARRSYLFQVNEERDRDIVEYLDQVRQEVNLATFFRTLIRDYMEEHRNELNLHITADLNEIPKPKKKQ